MVYRLIEEHRRDGDRGDLLSAMLAAQAEMGWTDSGLRDQVLTVFLAGIRNGCNRADLDLVPAFAESRLPGAVPLRTG